MNEMAVVNTIRAVAAEAFWRMPYRFTGVRALGPSYSLRCLVFHDISAIESPFTKGMGMCITPASFEAALAFATRYYTPVSLQDVLEAQSRGLPPRAVLITFDDGYASVKEWAVPLCVKWAVPAVFFLNAAFVGALRLAPDNLVCWASNVLGMDCVNAAARSVKGRAYPAISSMNDVFSRFFPTISRDERQRFLAALVSLGGMDERELAEEARLYVTPQEIGELAAQGFEIGNHTYTHVRCRSLTPTDFAEEIDANKGRLEEWTRRPVRSFSVPYGSSADLNESLARHLEATGHEAVFLSESVANPWRLNPCRVDRVSVRGGSDESFFFEFEVMPRLRAARQKAVRMAD